jgi:hypothetical protein
VDLGVFRRGRCIVGGAITDDIDQYNRVHEFLNILSSKANRDNDLVDGFGYRWDGDGVYSVANQDFTNANFPSILGANASKRVNFKPIFGVVNQPEISYHLFFGGGISFEFEVVTNATDAVASQTDGD